MGVVEARRLIQGGDEGGRGKELTKAGAAPALARIRPIPSMMPCEGSDGTEGTSSTTSAPDSLGEEHEVGERAPVGPEAR